MWFLTAYVPFAAYGQGIARIARRPVVSVAVCLSLLVVIDIARFEFDANEKWGWPSFFLAWGIPWIIGAWWRNAAQSALFHEKRVGAVLAISGAIICVLLVKTANYYPALIDAVPGKRSNTTPPTVFTATAAITQTGVLILVASSLDGVASRWRSRIDALGRMSVAVYAWHLSALALCAGLIALGVYAPTRFGLAWWMSRPLWFALVAGLTSLFVIVTAFVQKKFRDPLIGRKTGLLFQFGVALSVVGSGVIGLYGPRTLPGAMIASCSLVGSWWCLRTRESTDQTAKI